MRVLNLLADDFGAHQFDLRRLIQLIAQGQPRAAIEWYWRPTNQVRAILEALHRTTDDAHIRPYIAVGVLYSNVVPGRLAPACRCRGGRGSG